MKTTTKKPLISSTVKGILLLIGLLAVSAGSTLLATGDVRCLVTKCIVVKH